MKRIIVHGGFSPFANPTADEVLSKKCSIGGNTGNMMFINSIYRNLMTHDFELIPDYYRLRLTEKQIDFMNSECSLFCIPLADAFRNDNILQLERMAALVERLKIPCVIIGVGLREKYTQKLGTYSFDNAAKRLISAVLDKSSIIGCRGEFTGKYLHKLGFSEEKHYTVIGCPSMYMFGSSLHIRDPKVCENPTIAYNANTLAPDDIGYFFKRSVLRTEKSYFVQQKQSEIRQVFLGGDFPENIYGDDLYLRMLSEERIKYFTNVIAWIDFLKKCDYSVSTRFHGAVAAIHAGTPGMVIPIDSRMKELCEYHKLPILRINEINEHTMIEDVIERLDFHLPEQVAEQNFKHFLEFLHKNSIHTIYDEDCKPRYDILAAQVDWNQTEKPYCNVALFEKVRRRTRTMIGKPISYYDHHINLFGKEERI